MEVKKYDYLPSEAIDIRTKVFVFEQGFTDEIDDIDATSLHFLAFCEGIAVGTCRVFKTNDGYILGRLAVLKQYRKKGVGSTLLKFAENFILNLGFNSLVLHSQIDAVKFYENCGYQKFGEIEYEQGCPHIWMKKKF